MSLIISNLSARVKDGAQILNGINLEIPKGQVHAIMGPNGSGKSTLSKVLCGHPDYEVTDGSAELDGQNLFAMSVDERSRAGLFLAFQYPVEVPGVTNANFMRAALQARLPKGEEIDAVSFYKELRSKMKELGISYDNDLELIKNIQSHTSELQRLVYEMIEARKVANRVENQRQRAIMYHDTVEIFFDEIRTHIDRLEEVIDDQLWPLPKYRELLFIK